MNVSAKSPMFVWTFSLIAGIVLAIAYGFVGSPLWSNEIPMWLLWAPSLGAGIFLGATFASRRIAAGISAAIPLFVLGVVGIAGLLPYGKVSDSWPVIWGAHLFSLWAGVYLATGFSRNGRDETT